MGARPGQRCADAFGDDRKPRGDRTEQRRGSEFVGQMRPGSRQSKDERASRRCDAAELQLRALVECPSPHEPLGELGHVLDAHRGTEEPRDCARIALRRHRLPGVEPKPLPDRERVRPAVGRPLRVARRHLGLRSRERHQLRAGRPENHSLRWSAGKRRIDRIDAGIDVERDPERAAVPELHARRRLGRNGQQKTRGAPNASEEGEGFATQCVGHIAQPPACEGRGVSGCPWGKALGRCPRAC